MYNVEEALMLTEMEKMNDCRLPTVTVLTLMILWAMLLYSPN